MFAAACGHKDIVEYLLSKTRDGLDVNALDDTQKSALHHAARRTKPLRQGERTTTQADIAQLLLRAGAAIESRDHNGCTSLMFAAANGANPVTDRLLGERANVDVMDYEGRTSLDYALQFGHAGVARMLRNAGCKASRDAAPPGISSVKAGVGKDGMTASERYLANNPPKSTDSEEQPVGGDTATSDEPAASSISGVKKAKVPPPPVCPKKKQTETQGTSAGMMEAVAGEDDGKIDVEDEDQKSSKRDRATAKLRTLVESGDSATELKSAIKDAKEVGVDDTELANAEKQLERLILRGVVMQELTDAMDHARNPAGDVDDLRGAMQRAVNAKVPASMLDEAEQVLQDEEPKHLARGRLRKAQDKGNVDKLRSALSEAQKAGVPAGELKKFEDCLAGAESKDKAEALLKKAMEDLDVPGLKFAIPQAKSAGVDKALVSEARIVLEEEEPKANARALLTEAIEKPTIARLREAIKAAKDAKLERKEYKQADVILREEEEKERFMKEVNTSLNDTQKVDLTDIDSLREMKGKLGKAINSALAAGIKEQDLREAETRRKKLHNAIEDLKGSIRVFARVRPLSKKEKAEGSTQVTKTCGMMGLTLESSEKKEEFTFDSVFAPGTQEEVFEDCQDLVQSAVDGYNVTMFAYGQTGAGKTYTMYGTPGDEGTAPRTIKEIFRVLEVGQHRYAYTVMASMMELYRNDLVDLLNKSDVKTAKKLTVRQEKSGLVSVDNLIEEQCEDAEALDKLLKRGTDQRTVAATAMNSESSRSHLILSIRIVSVNRETKETTRGKLLICDLAGSERIGKSQVVGDMQKEAIEINKSLTALGDVIEALTKGNKSVPYRNHKLTQLLQDSLGGASKTLMFVNCSPASSNYEETVMSLKYAQRAKKVTNQIQAPAESKSLKKQPGVSSTGEKKKEKTTHSL